MDEDFQILTTEINDQDIKSEINSTSPKSHLNKVSKKHDLVTADGCHLKPKWNIDTNTKIGKIYDCLDITKFASDDKIKKVKDFSVLSREKFLAPGLLEFFRCVDGNREYFSKKYISFSICHPHKKCLIVGSNEGTLNIFKVDGETNDAMCKPMYFERYPIKGGKLLPDGSKLVFFSKRNYFKVLNLTTNTVTQHSIEKPSIIHRMEVSPTGDYLVISTTNSIIHVVSTKSFDVIHKLQVSGAVKSLAFSHNGKYLYAFEDRGKISVFEFHENGKPVFLRQWIDKGCIDAVCIAISRDNQYVACGSTGNVNIYHLNDTWQHQNPNPIKSIEYPQARNNQLLFNHSSEILAIGYSIEGDPNNGSYKLVHLESLSVFSNFPGPSGKVRPTSLSFSPNGKYLAVGQFNGRVALFNLKYYNKY